MSQMLHWAYLYKKKKKKITLNSNLAWCPVVLFAKYGNIIYDNVLPFCHYYC